MLLPRLTLVWVIVHFINGSVVDLTRLKRDEPRQTDESSRTPSNIRIRAGESSLEVHWAPPLETNAADHCAIEYKDSPFWGRPVSEDHSTIRLEIALTSHVISGLHGNTRYELRLFCSYGNTRGSATDWIYASTRTVSVEKNICSGSIPHAYLDHLCVDYPRHQTCEYTCEDGYIINEVAAVLNNNFLWGDSILIFCRNGTWITNFEDEGLFIEDICLPEAVFDKCPASIPNGKLQKHCGPALDWLCEFECNPGYEQHPFMGSRLKGFNNKPEKLLCGDDGIWKTGYEDVGLDISGLCFSKGFDRNCTTDIPHASVHKPCPSGYVCAPTCDDGYRLRVLAEDDWVSCVTGEWALRATKYDQSITPQTLCVPEARQSSCPREIPNGHIPAGCTANCEPVCNDGYDVIGNHGLSMAPVTVTCDNGQWLTKSEPYTGENICFPEGGMLCPPEIPNGEFSDYPERLKDYGRNREYMSYRCRDGYRNNRGVQFIECVAGKWSTWNERFGIDTSDLCIPINIQRIQ